MFQVGELYMISRHAGIFKQRNWWPQDHEWWKMSDQCYLDKIPHARKQNIPVIARKPITINIACETIRKDILKVLSKKKIGSSSHSTFSKDSLEFLKWEAWNDEVIFRRIDWEGRLLALRLQKSTCRLRLAAWGFLESEVKQLQLRWYCKWRRCNLCSTFGGIVIDCRRLQL